MSNEAEFPSPAPDVAALRKLARSSHTTEDHRRLYWKIDYVTPYPKALELFELGATKRERLFKAANQSGKSFTSAIENSYHLTGRYPQWWKGYRSSTAISAWVCSETSLTLRDTMQKLLFGAPGDPEAFGTGMVPLDLIGDRITMARGNVSDAYDTVRIKHISGKWSTCHFRPYRAGREAFQGATVNLITFDEEPPSDVYFEGLTRISATRGRSLMGYTPMGGPGEVTRRFTDEDSPDRAIVKMSLYDICDLPNTHMIREMVEEIVRNTPPHMVRTRIFGEDMLGEGAIFPVDEQTITEPPLQYVPDHWFKIWGIDFGIGHPFAAVLLLYDADADCVHVHHCVRLKDQTPLQHAVPMKAIGADVVVAYPADGDSRQMGTGDTLAKLYRVEDLRLTSSHARFEDGSNSTDRGNLEIWQRMTTGRFKVASTQGIWFEEMRSYHRKNNQIVKIHDDLMSATRIGLMALRFAKQGPLGSKRPPLQNRMAGGLARGVDFDVFNPRGGSDDFDLFGRG